MSNVISLWVLLFGVCVDRYDEFHMWIIFALCAALPASFHPSINKRLLADTDVSVVAWAGQAFGLPLLEINPILIGVGLIIIGTYLLNLSSWHEAMSLCGLSFIRRLCGWLSRQRAVRTGARGIGVSVDERGDGFGGASAQACGGSDQIQERGLFQPVKNITTFAPVLQDVRFE